MADAPYFHADSGAVRFWVTVPGVEGGIADASVVGASISKEVLHYRYQPQGHGEDPLETYRAHAAEIEAAVRRRVARGSIEPVMLRESDLPTEAPHVI